MSMQWQSRRAKHQERESLNYDRLAEHCVAKRQQDFKAGMQVYDALIIGGLALAALGLPMFFAVLWFLRV
jgi:hypothetical protein